MENNELIKEKEKCNIIIPKEKNDNDLSECSKKDFVQDGHSPICLGFLGSAIKVIHKNTNKAYSIKVMKKEKIIKANKLHIFNYELENMYKVKHPLFLRLLSHFKDKENIYLIFQYVKGNTLLDKINQNKLQIHSIYKYFKQIVIGLKYLQDLGIHYVCLEPEYIILDENDNIRLTDYGWSRIVSQEMNKRNGIKLKNDIYLNNYTPPEFISLRKENNLLEVIKKFDEPLANLWQLGIILYEMIFLKMPINLQSIEKENQENILEKFKNFNFIDSQNENMENYKEFYKSKLNSEKIESKTERILQKGLSINNKNKKDNNTNDIDIIFEIIKELLKVNSKERLTLDQILEISSIQKINFKLIENSNSNVSGNDYHKVKNNQEQIINELKTENERLNLQNIKLKIKIQNLNHEIIDLKIKQKNINPNTLNLNSKELINKELVETRSELRKLKIYLDLKEQEINEEKIKNQKYAKKLANLINDKNDKYSENEKVIVNLEEKIKSLEDKIFIEGKNAGYNKFLDFFLPIFNENMIELKEEIEKLMVNSSKETEKIINSTVNYLNEKKDFFKKFIKEKQKEINEIIIDKIKSNFINDSSQNKIEWYIAQINELSSCKFKCNNLENEINKIKNVNTNLMEKNLILENEKENILKIKDLAIYEKNKILENKQKLDSKIKDAKEFIAQNCPDLFDKFINIINK